MHSSILTTRRKFLASSALMASASVLGIRGSAHARAGEAEQPAVLERTLGKTGIKGPIVGMGVMNAENPALIRRAYELGVRHFDTAANYQRGRNETMLGKMIAELKARDKVTIATKIYIPEHQRAMPAADIKRFYLKSCDESLQRLGMDQVDILYSHSISTKEWLNHPAIVEALQELKASGKTRSIGFTTHMNMDAMLQEAIQSGAYDVVLATFNYSFHDYRAYLDTLRQAAARGIGIVAMKTQCQQSWYKSENPEGIRRFYEGEILHSALLKWVLRHDFIAWAIPGYTAFAQIEEDMPVAFGLEYTDKEKKFLEDRNVTLGMNAVCRQCGECVGSCPSRVDLPTLMRVHMYATEYGNVHHARQTLDEVPSRNAVGACASCVACSARCVRGVDIVRRVGELKALFA